MATATMVTSVYNVWTKTEMRPRVKALCGTIPWWMLMLDLWIIFAYSEWAWENGGYACFVLAPYVCMINCRQIICNMARQEDAWFQPLAFLFFAFPLNRLLPQLLGKTDLRTQGGVPILVDESWVALAIFLVSSLEFILFVVGTVEQIKD